MNRKEPTKTFMMISISKKKHLDSMFYTKFINITYEGTDIVDVPVPATNTIFV